MQNKKIYFIGSGLTLIIYLVLPLLVEYVLKDAEGTIGIAVLIHFVVGPIESFILGIVFRSYEKKIWIIVLLELLCIVLVSFIAYGGVSYIWFISIASLFLGYTIGYYVYENI